MLGRAGATVIDDSYNANPGSVRAALDHLAALAGTRILVLGNMAELGPTGPDLHREIGEYARGRCDQLVAIGDLARVVLEPQLGVGVTVLVKGSRVMGLDRLVKALEKEVARSA
jgi:UDP-N-acetylmuramoyl-tripeptide--D-alanyl-D-alanine ligase